LSSSSRRSGRARLALLGGLIAAGCYHGSARNITLAELGGPEPHAGSRTSWERVTGMPDVRQVAREDCGAAALAMVLGYWQKAGTRNEITAATTPGAKGGIAAADLRDFARRRGLQAFVIEGGLDDLEREIRWRHPIVVGMMKRYGQRDYPHYEVVVGLERSRGRVLTLDPASGLRVNSREGFVAEWTAARRVTLVVYPTRASVPQQPEGPPK
jgi:ABC-type bacteriocin/lantibiotic exporter with double-glycine peptidase domain